MRRDDRAPRAGFILLAVLVVFALAASLLGAISLLARSAVDGAVVVADDLRAGLILDAGITLAAWQLFGAGRSADDLAGQEIRFDAGVVRIAVEGEAGRVDLNGAAPVLLAAAWRAAGRRGLSADAFAARVVDWRDEDGDDEEDGAETAAYAAAGLPAPRDGPFRTVGDLAFVLGVGPDDVAALDPFLTVYNPDGRLAAGDAPRALLDALPGLSAAAAGRIADGAIPDDLVGAVIVEPGRVFRIRADLVEGPVRRALEAVVIPAVGSDAPFLTVARRSLLR